MRRFLSTIVDVRKGEGLLTLLMFVCYYLILVTYYFLKPARDSLFLVNLGAAQLPVVFILTAVLIAPITALLRPRQPADAPAPGHLRNLRAAHRLSDLHALSP